MSCHATTLTREHLLIPSSLLVSFPRCWITSTNAESSVTSTSIQYGFEAPRFALAHLRCKVRHGLAQCTIRNVQYQLARLVSCGCVEIY